jgi:hypothetical protein
MWNVKLVRLEEVLVSVQDRCTVCAKRTTGSEIILVAPDGTPIQGQGSSHTLVAPQDVFEAKREGRRRNPLGGRHRALESHRKESRSIRPLFGIFESASMAASRLLSNGARAPTRIPH